MVSRAGKWEIGKIYQRRTNKDVGELRERAIF